MTILRVSHVSKAFGTQTVLKDVSLTVKEHQVLGLIGQNGAGKTTLMRSIVGLLPLDQGEIYLGTEQVHYGKHQVSQQIGYLPDVPEFYPYMTARDYLRLCGEISGLTVAEMNEKVAELLELVGLADNRKKIKHYSRGMKQRLGIAQALLNSPQLLICDEPTSALDPVGREDILTILERVKATTTVIFSSHILSDVERICDQVVLLDEQQIKLDLPLPELHQKFGLKRLYLEFDPAIPEETISQLLAGLASEVGEKRHCVYIDGSELTSLQGEVYRRCLAAEIFPLRCDIATAHLNDIFKAVVK